MPRIYTSYNDPLDFCIDCWRYKVRTEERARSAYHGGGEGPDGRGDCWGYNEDHPPYEDCDYECEICRKQLGEEDNGY